MAVAALALLTMITAPLALAFNSSTNAAINQTQITAVAPTGNDICVNPSNVVTLTNGNITNVNPNADNMAFTGNQQNVQNSAANIAGVQNKSNVVNKNATTDVDDYTLSGKNGVTITTTRAANGNAVAKTNDGVYTNAGGHDASPTNGSNYAVDVDVGQNNGALAVNITNTKVGVGMN